MPNKTLMKYNRQITSTPKATMFELGTKEVFWIPNSQFSYVHHLHQAIEINDYILAKLRNEEADKKITFGTIDTDEAQAELCIAHSEQLRRERKHKS